MWSRDWIYAPLGWISENLACTFVIQLNKMLGLPTLSFTGGESVPHRLSEMHRGTNRNVCAGSRYMQTLHIPKPLMAAPFLQVTAEAQLEPVFCFTTTTGKKKNIYILWTQPKDSQRTRLYPSPSAQASQSDRDVTFAALPVFTAPSTWGSRWRGTTLICCTHALSRVCIWKPQSRV